MPTLIETFAMTEKLDPILFPQDARSDSGNLGPSQTLAKGTVLGKKTSDGLLYAYAHANSDGTQTAVAILMYSIKTDANGKVYFSTDSATASYRNNPFSNAPIWIAGTFDPATLTGWDSYALAAMGARLLPSGLIRIP